MLKLNLILNGLISSLDNAIQGDTLVSPYHKESDGTLKKFDYVVSNPPFKMDFSDTRDQIAEFKSRFWAGVPNILPTDPSKMEIYTCFIQHVVNSLKDEIGKGAIVVPAGFITATTGIAAKVKKHIVDNKIVYGVISMPANVFANTPTSVSVVFFDNSRKNDKVILINASNLGEEYKDSNGLKKVRLSSKEVDKIVNTFINKQTVDDFSVAVTYDQIKTKKYSLSAGQHFGIRIKHADLSEQQFNEKMEYYKKELIEDSAKELQLINSLVEQLEGLKYAQND